MHNLESGIPRPQKKPGTGYYETRVGFYRPGFCDRFLHFSQTGYLPGIEPGIPGG